MLAIHSREGITHIDNSTLGAGEKVSGGANGMGVDSIGSLVTGLVKDRLLGCIRQVLQQVSGKVSSSNSNDPVVRRKKTNFKDNGISKVGVQLPFPLPLPLSLP